MRQIADVKRLAHLSSLIALVGALACVHRPSVAVDQASLWRANKPAAYSFEYRLDCFCFQNGIWWRVEVRSDTVSRVRLVNAADSAATASQVDLVHPTIDSVYADLDRVLEMPGARVRVRYDAKAHYPVDIDVDESERIADDEWHMFLRHFRRIRG